MRTIVCFCVCALLIHPNVLGNIIIDTSLGKIEGLELKTPNGTDFYAFLGIPFAKPPVGPLRFLAPQPAEKWSGTLNAIKDANPCYEVKVSSTSASEDCLYLNVFVPVLENHLEKLPVMVWIYGGSFQHGHAGYGNGGPEWMLEQGIIFVNFNYRVGPFGFVSTDDTVAPGNAGLKDQELAIKWTHENIASFGGDPAKVTVAGQSAGGASVGFQLLNKNVAGMFRAAIAESGSPLCDWAFRANQKAVTYRLAQVFNSSITSKVNSQGLLDYLQSIDAELIHTASANVQSFLPVIEPEHEGALITQEFYEAIAAGNVNKVPLLIGFNSEEEIIMGKDLTSLQASAVKYDADHTLLESSSLLANTTYKNFIGDIIANTYVPDTTFGKLPGALIRWKSDFQFIRPVIRHAKMYSSYSNVYLYEFTYDGKMGNIDIHVEGAETVGHGEETKYLFILRSKVYDNTIDANFPASDIITRQRAIKLWTNFVKYLNPTPDVDPLFQNITWPTTSANNFQYLDIGENLEIKTNPKGKYYIMWEQVYDQYGVRPFVTY